MQTLTGKIKTFTTKPTPVDVEYTAIVTPDGGGADIIINGRNPSRAAHNPGDKVTYFATNGTDGKPIYTLKK